MNKYEVVLIIKPAEEEVVNAVITKFENLIQNNGGEVEKIDRWGKRRLAYAIKDIMDGYYCIITFVADPKVIFEFDRVMKLTDDLLKHMIIKEKE